VPGEEGLVIPVAGRLLCLEIFPFNFVMALLEVPMIFA